MTCISSFRWKSPWYQDETATVNRRKTWLLKPVCGKKPMKRGVGSRKVALSVRGKIINMTSKQQNERDLTI